MFKGVASRALAVFALFTVVCGLGYTFVVTGVAQLVFPHQANGSLIEVDGKVKGSELIGQNFEDPAHMWGRIQNVSVVEGEDGELMAYSAPSNLSPASPEYQKLVDERVQKIRSANPDADMDQVPVDLVTCSGSGLDPAISPDAAEYQVPRLAKETGKSEDEVRDIIAKCTKGRFLGVFGEPTVNVLEVNLMLDGELK
ncbi:MAG: potassium-transporting ATPase subunit KdpC [Coriobacteriaceae bacterium]|nr:potassium-transporting ATPase subunit KdpC [Coriobacteriaceae bacterium]